jgi:nitroreductase
MSVARSINASRITRRALLTGGGSVVLLAACGTSIQAPAYRAWFQKEPGTLTHLEYIVQCGTLAPSAHNTQPWKFRLMGNRVQVFADRERQLGSADVERRMMLMSIGCALENMLVAAAQLGYRAVVTDLDADAHFASSGYCATVELKKTRDGGSHPWFDAIFARQTTRAAFEPLASPARQMIESLNRAQDLSGIGLRWFTGHRALDALANLSRESVRSFLQTDQRHRDGMRWFRITREDWERHCDGIAVFTGDASPVVKQYIEWFATPEEVMSASFKQGEIDIVDRIAPATPLWGLIFATRATQNLRVQAGRMAERVYLDATQRGLSVQPICYPTEVDTGREQLRRLASLRPEAEPLFLFRVGQSTHRARSVRRPLSDVLMI